MTRARWTDALMIAAVTIMATLSGDARGAQDTSATLTPAALAEIARVEAEIDRIEAHSLERLAAPPDNQVQQIELLGKARPQMPSVALRAAAAPGGRLVIPLDGLSAVSYTHLRAHET